MRRHIEIVEVAQDQKATLRQLIELYEYDFSEYHKRDVNEHGLFGYKYFDHYWTESGRHPFFVKVDRHYAGFVLVNSHCYLHKSGEAKSIAEFFIMRKYRRYGIGSAAAIQVFDRFRGAWEVLQHGENEPSKLFWQDVIERYTKGQFRLLDVATAHWEGQGFVFNNVLPQSSGREGHADTERGPINVVPAREQLLKAAADLACKLWPDHSPDNMIDEFGELLQSDRDIVYVALDGEIGVGFIHVSLRYEYVEGSAGSPVGYIEGIYVEEAHRNQGISRKLVAAAEKWLQLKGCTEIASDTSIDNEAGQGFHRRMGFRQAGIQVAFIRELAETE